MRWSGVSQVSNFKSSPPTLSAPQTKAPTRIARIDEILCESRAVRSSHSKTCGLEIWYSTRAEAVNCYGAEKTTSTLSEICYKICKSCNNRPPFVHLQHDIGIVDIPEHLIKESQEYTPPPLVINPDATKHTAMELKEAVERGASLTKPIAISIQEQPPPQPQPELPSVSPLS